MTSTRARKPAKDALHASRYLLNIAITSKPIVQAVRGLPGRPDEKHTKHEQPRSSPTEPAGLAVIVRIMQVEVMINLASDKVSYSVEILNAPCSIAVAGCLLQIAERSLMLAPQYHLMRPQPACQCQDACAI